jgi:hypothetical protein
VAEKTITVCDVCGKPAAETAAIVVGNRRMLKDLCEQHLSDLMSGARAPRRGRRPGIRTGSPARRATGGARASARSGAATEARRLRDQGLSYREIGEELMRRGIRPPRAKAWNRVVIGRMVQPKA